MLLPPGVLPHVCHHPSLDSQFWGQGFLWTPVCSPMPGTVVGRKQAQHGAVTAEESDSQRAWCCAGPPKVNSSQNLGKGPWLLTPGPMQQLSSFCSGERELPFRTKVWPTLQWEDPIQEFPASLLTLLGPEPQQPRCSGAHSTGVVLPLLSP